MQKDGQQKKDLLTIGEASEYLGISIDTLRRWEKKGRIEPFRSPGGHRYFNKKDLDDLFGKRYTRDEETVRRSFKKQEEPLVIPEEETKKNENIKIEPPRSPVVGLPHWRAIKESDYREEIIETKVTEDQIFDRPAREVKIPQNTSIRIIKREASISPEEAYFRQQSVSVLTPQNISMTSPAGITQTQETKNSISSLLPKVKVANLTEDDRKFYIFLGVLTLIVILSIIWYVVWKNSQVVLSPIP